MRSRAGCGAAAAYAAGFRTVMGSRAKAEGCCGARLSLRGGVDKTKPPEGWDYGPGHVKSKSVNVIYDDTPKWDLNDEPKEKDWRIAKEGEDSEKETLKNVFADWDNDHSSVDDSVPSVHDPDPYHFEVDFRHTRHPRDIPPTEEWAPLPGERMQDADSSSMGSQARALQAEGMDVHESNEGCGGHSIKHYEKIEKQYWKDIAAEEENGGNREWFNKLPHIGHVNQNKPDFDWGSSEVEDFKNGQNPYQHATVAALEEIKHDYDRKWVDMAEKSWETPPVKAKFFEELTEENFDALTREKYHKIFTGEINSTMVKAAINAGALNTEESTLALLNSFLADNITGHDYVGVGFNFTCRAPHFVCVITYVAPVLSAWDNEVNPGDVVTAIGGEGIEDIVKDAICRFNKSSDAMNEEMKAQDFDAFLEEAEQSFADHSLEDADEYVRSCIEQRLAGKVGSNVSVTMRRTFRHIERTLRGQLRRHAAYDGHSVHRTLNLTRGTREAIPPNWVYGMHTLEVHKEGFRRKAELAELFEAGLVTKEEVDANMSQFPKSFTVRDETGENTHKVVRHHYVNTKTDVLSLAKPTADPPKDTTSSKKRRDRQHQATIDLWAAANEGKEEGIKQLVEQGADINYRNPDWRLAAPIHKAAEHGHSKVFDLLVSLGADVHIQNQLGWNALNYASLNGRLSIVKHLLDLGLSADSRTHANWTPLHHAAMRGNFRTMRVLLERGADKRVFNKQGCTVGEMVLALSQLKSHKEDLQQACLDVLAPLPEDTRTIDQLRRAGLKA